VIVTNGSPHLADRAFGVRMSRNIDKLFAFEPVAMKCRRAP
jgi:hypothetical protein